MFGRKLRNREKVGILLPRAGFAYDCQIELSLSEQHGACYLDSGVDGYDNSYFFSIGFDWVERKSGSDNGYSYGIFND